MTPRPAGSLLNYLEQVPDPRGRHGQRHPLAAMLAASICAILSGFRGYTAIAQWIHSQDVSLWHLLGFTRRPPGHDCFRDLLMTIDPKALEEGLWKWIRDGLGIEMDDEEVQAIVIDGKVLRGTREKHLRALQTLSLLNLKTGFAHSETPVDPATNEAKTGLNLLKDMVLKGQVVLGDAAYCDQEICKEIVDSDGDYLVIVKDNQPNLHRDVRQAFVVPEGFSPYAKKKAYAARQTAETTEKKRGRVEKRKLTTTTVGTDTSQWPGLKQFLRLERTTIIDGQMKKNVQYAVTSLSRDQANAEELLKLVRGRWAIENRLFWVRDVVFGEDASRIRTGTAPTTMSIFRNTAITLLRGLKVPNITAALRENALKLNLLLQRLGIVNKT